MQHTDPQQDIALGSLIFLMVVALFFYFKQEKDMRLINRAAKFLEIPPHLLPFFYTDLLSLYNHQELLKYTTDKIEFLQLVATNDEPHLQCIMKKIDDLLVREKEYGEAFVADYYHQL